jgi:hypothetical protein
MIILAILLYISPCIHAFQMNTLEWRRSSLASHPRNLMTTPPCRALQQQPREIIRCHRHSLWLSIENQNGNDDENEKISASDNDASGNNNSYQNPYADPNYPDLEFIDYSNPNYVVDQGIVEDEFFSTSPRNTDQKDDEEDMMIEEMREDRRRRNDEYQFETYYTKVLQEGQEYRGEWTMYHTDTFLPTSTTSTSSTSYSQEEEITPRLVPSPKTLQVISKGYKIQVEDPQEVKFRVDAERICHVERIIVMGDDNSNNNNNNKPTNEQGKPAQEATALQQQVEDLLRNQYWPIELCARDFRGDMGIMCVGNAYTICTSRPYSSTATISSSDEFIGPFSEHWTELGLSADRLRLRIKLHYSILPANGNNNNNNMASPSSSLSTAPPPLYLKSLTVCREMLDMWPSDAATTYPVVWDALFGSSGAPGGLFDPPPVGSADQARHYRLIELPGRATILIPVQLDQDPALVQVGWVTSLDWTSPNAMRYQVDRKVKSGNYISGLRTLELSEIQSENAERYRPRDGGQDMRQ